MHFFELSEFKIFRVQNRSIKFHKIRYIFGGKLNPSTRVCGASLFRGLVMLQIRYIFGGKLNPGGFGGGRVNTKPGRYLIFGPNHLVL